MRAHRWGMALVLLCTVTTGPVMALDPCPGGQAQAAGPEARFYRDSRGDYRLRGRIGRSAVTFRLAPEADTLVLGEREAARLGLRYSRGRIVRHQGAAGVGLGHAVVLDSVQVGGLVRERVAAVVVTGDGSGEVLLGQSFLRGLRRCRDAGAIVLRALYHR
ncbi:TIGR02281 family clan AA aspartic protease [Marichromatium sp. AB32]|uniref:retropepsin-like aspartic protease family protein n=1 Tax=Marichromatium sp. AB32 TaxID=2483363 RepID=UPI000F3B8676|nr:retroviral-like aspartic protease family protein [Marichromatium sp. AB32]RNE94300.1 hypothetical protein EBL85_02470 [Marichromatium sp. AB32]